MNRSTGLVIAGLVALAPVAAAAQSASGAPAAGSETPVPDTDVSKRGGTLSDKLSDTKGVIRPEGAVDPGMQKAPPATGTMPVVPPPGSRGGARDVEPK